MDTADTDRLWERDADRGVDEETEEEEALLEPEPDPEPMPEVSRDDRDVHSQNWRGGHRRGRLERSIFQAATLPPEPLQPMCS